VHLADALEKLPAYIQLLLSTSCHVTEIIFVAIKAIVLKIYASVWQVLMVITVRLLAMLRW
jgi:hypothetical protein